MKSLDKGAFLSSIPISLIRRLNFINIDKDGKVNIDHTKQNMV